MMSDKNKQGFTMVELIVVVAVLLILSAAVFSWIDPLARVGEAKNKRRIQDINIIGAALAAYSGDTNGALPILGAVATSTKKVLCSAQSGSVLDCNGDSDICLKIDDQRFYEKYLPSFPYDPNKTSTEDTGYYLLKDSNGQLEIGACETYNSEIVSRTLSVRVTCPAYGGGKCWYIAGTAGQDCDTVCTANNLSCANNTSYGPDVTSLGAGACVLNQSFGYLGIYTCGSGCTSDDSSSWPPVNQDGTSACRYRTYPTRCVDKAIGYFSICPCD